MSTEFRPIFFTAPETDIRSGGYTAEVDTLNLLKDVCAAELITYEKRCSGYRYLDDILSDLSVDDAIFIVHWGPDVPFLVKRLADRNVVYHAYSTGYGFKLPVDVPIISASKHTLAFWGAQAPCSVLYHVPVAIPYHFSDMHGPRDIDVLVQRRKSSKYVLSDLIPRLRQELRVTVLDDWVDDLAAYFNRTKVYLYDSSDYWHNRGLSEGFGLPPLEAIACGCSVFSSVNHALSDFLRPGVNCQKIRCTSIDYDVKRICMAAKTWVDGAAEPAFLQEYRPPSVIESWRQVLRELNTCFDERIQHWTKLDPADRLKVPKIHSAIISRAVNRLRALRSNDSK